MPEMDVAVGGRSFTVACQEGEEPYLEAAAQMLDREAQTLLQSGVRLPADRMLLMAGLMLADKALSADEELRALDRRIAAQSREIEQLQAGAAAARPDPAPAPAPAPEVREVEVVRDVVPERLVTRMEALADRAEALAGQMAEG